MTKEINENRTRDTVYRVLHPEHDVVIGGGLVRIHIRKVQGKKISMSVDVPRGVRVETRHIRRG